MKKGARGVTSQKLDKSKYRYLLNGLMMLGVNIMFMIFGFVFLGIDIAWLQIIFAFMFLAPVAFMCFSLGSGCGKNDYSLFKQDNLNKTKKIGDFDVPENEFSNKKSFLYIISFIVPITLILLLACAFDIKFLRGIIVMIFVHVSLFYLGIGAMAMEVSVVGWMPMLYYMPVVIVLCAIFIVGYFLATYKCKKQDLDIANEIRMFDK